MSDRVPICGTGLTVSRAIWDEAWIAYAKQYGHTTAQHDRLLRQGFYVEELDDLRPGWRPIDQRIAELEAQLAAEHEKHVKDVAYLSKKGDDALAELAQALEANQRLTYEVQFANHEKAGAHHSQVENLKAQLVTARRDALRYRWWTENYGAEYDGPGTMKLYTIVKHGKFGTKAQFDAAIDAAIDRALQAERKEGK